MKRVSKTLVVASSLFTLIALTADYSDARGRGGAGGRSAGHRAPSAGRSMSRGPSMSRPSPSRPSMSRPSPSRPSVSRPSPSRPSVSRPSPSRPSISRPSPSRPSVSRPSTSRPSLPSGGNNRPTISRPGGNTPSFTRPGSGSGISRPGSGSGISRPGGGSGISRPGTGISRPGSGPSSSQLNDFLGNKGPSTRPNRPTTLPGKVPGIGNGDRPSLGGGDLPGIGNGNRPGIGNGDRPGIGNGDRPNIGNGNRPNIGNGDRTNIGSGNNRVGNINIGNSVNFSKDSKAWINNRHDVGNRVRGNAGNRYANVYRNGSYRRGIVGGYPYYGRWAGRGLYYGWRRPTRVAFVGFLGAAWATTTPVYYAYGSGGNVYYEDNTVYVNGEASGTPVEYAQEAIDIAAAAPLPSEQTVETSDEDWLPLGVFAFTQEDVDDSQAMIELAVNKDAVIAGTYYNEATNVSRPLKGSIDQESQRAVFGFADGKDENIVVETGMYSLTEEEATGLLHLGTEDSNPVLLVRLEAPEEE